MVYVILIVLFIAVFAFILWRVVMGQRASKVPARETSYVCSQCNELDCKCEKTETKQ